MALVTSSRSATLPAVPLAPNRLSGGLPPASTLPPSISYLLLSDNNFTGKWGRIVNEWAHVWMD